MAIVRQCSRVRLTFGEFASFLGRSVHVVVLLANALLFLSGFFYGGAAAQSSACNGQAETALRQRALESSNIEDSTRYLSCFPYGDGVVSVRLHHQKLQEDVACQKALASDRPDEQRTFILTWSGSECAARVATRLREHQSLSKFVNYPNTIFNGTPLRRGTIEDARACGVSCKSDSQSCKGYSFEIDQKICTLWGAIQSRVPRGNTESGSTGEVSLGLPQQQSQQPPSTAASQTHPEMRYLQDADLPGGDLFDLRDVTVEQCNAMCIERNECLGFTYNVGARACFLKNWVNRPLPFAGAISGFKPSAVMKQPAAAPMRLMDNIDLPSDDPSKDYALIKAIPLNECQVRCETDGQCAAFTYNHRQQACILKRGFTRRIVFFGATSGIK